jgi:hypothetical protein
MALRVHNGFSRTVSPRGERGGGVEKQKLFQSKCHHRPCLRLTDRALTTTTHAFVLLAGHRFVLSRNEMVLTRRGPATARLEPAESG